MIATKNACLPRRSEVRSVRDSRRGSALMAIVPIVLVLASLGASLMFLTVEDSAESGLERRLAQADLLADAGAWRAVAAIQAARSQDLEVPTELGTPGAPLEWGSGSTWATIADLGDGLFSIDATSQVGPIQRQVQAIVQGATASIYDYAIFAGNASGDPAYELRLSGTGSEADSIDGNLYSAGDILFDGDSYATGQVNATGTITGSTGNSGVTEQVPNIPAMNYPVNHDYDVAALFAGAAYASNPAGGWAFEVPETNPAHIFRKNPSDRSGTWSATTKDDYFLEDPFEELRADSDQDGTDPFVITLTGDSGSEKVFYIDGNLWIENLSSYSYQLQNENGDPVRVTFVVSGNITFTDNLFYANEATDAVAFVAIEDPLVPDSGNILFGDASGGTLEHVHAYMYAENDFTDFHLDTEGTKDVTLLGNMTAGNHVNIERDFEKADGSVAHSKLTLDFDNRIATGAVSLAGLPSSTVGAGALSIRMWRHVGVQSN